MTFNSRIKKYPRFIFQNFAYELKDDNIEITFNFTVPPDISFSPKVIIKSDLPTKKIQKKTLDNLVFHLGLAEIPSYWKATCSPEIEINCGFLNDEQKAWWKNLLLKGLGEFFYQNKIDFRPKDFVKVTTKSENKYQKDFSYLKERFLVPLGGGRDSAVTIETLKHLGEELALIVLNPTKAQDDVAKVSGVKNRIIVTRNIDKNLLDLNKKGYLNGHTPFSAYLSFLSTLAATLYDYKFVTPSNERSANEQNLNYLGVEINHQYSKTYQFEKDFRSYVKEYLSQDLNYFSFLRPLYEIQISKLFANYKKYFLAICSCNRGQKTNSWCQQCAKCLSVFISLFPFVDEEKMKQIFGTNLFDNENLKSLLLAITGISGQKPFECIGTYEEIKLALILSIDKYKKRNKDLPVLLNWIEEKAGTDLLTAWDKNNFLPEHIAGELKGKIDGQ